MALAKTFPDQASVYTKSLDRELGITERGKWDVQVLAAEQGFGDWVKGNDGSRFLKWNAMGIVAGTLFGELGNKVVEEALSISPGSDSDLAVIATRDYGNEASGLKVMMAFTKIGPKAISPCHHILLAPVGYLDLNQFELEERGVLRWKKGVFFCDHPVQDALNKDVSLRKTVTRICKSSLKTPFKTIEIQTEVSLVRLEDSGELHLSARTCPSMAWKYPFLNFRTKPFLAAAELFRNHFEAQQRPSDKRRRVLNAKRLHAEPVQ